MSTLQENEKIDSWDVIITTTKGRKISFTVDMGYDLGHSVCQWIDDCLMAEYPCSWMDEEED